MEDATFKWPGFEDLLWFVEEVPGCPSLLRVRNGVGTVLCLGCDRESADLAASNANGALGALHDRMVEAWMGSRECFRDSEAGLPSAGDRLAEAERRLGILFDVLEALR